MTWKLDESKLTQWNTDLSPSIRKIYFFPITSPEQATEEFMRSVEVPT